MKLSDKLRLYRYKNKLNQDDLCELLDIDRSYLSRIENDKIYPGWKTEFKIKELLGEELF